MTSTNEKSENRIDGQSDKIERDRKIAETIAEKFCLFDGGGCVYYISDVPPVFVGIDVVVDPSNPPHFDYRRTARVILFEEMKVELARKTAKFVDSLEIPYTNYNAVSMTSLRITKGSNSTPDGLILGLVFLDEAYLKRLRDKVLGVLYLQNGNSFDGIRFVTVWFQHSDIVRISASAEAK